MHIDRSSSSTSDYLDITLPMGLVRVSLNHEDQAVTVALVSQDEGRSVRATVTRSHCLALGASILLEDGGEHPVHVSLYLGPLAVYVAMRGSFNAGPPILDPVHPDDPPRYVPGLLRRAVRTLVGKYQRRKLSIELDRFDPETVDGPEVRISANLWNDDNHHRVGVSRYWSCNLSHVIWGKPEAGPDEVVETRPVTVALPEGPYPMTAQVVRRAVRWPRWPLVRYTYWVTFSPAPMLIPMRRSRSLQHLGNRAGGVAHVSARSIIGGVAELIRDVMRHRDQYGSRDWLPKPVAHSRDSHQITLRSTIRPAIDANDLFFDLFHGEPAWFSHTHGRPLRQVKIEYKPTAFLVGLSRDPRDGGVHLTRLPTAPLVFVDGAEVETAARVWPGSKVQIGAASFTAYFDPIGPTPPAVQLELVGNVASTDCDVEADVAEVSACLDTSIPALSERDSIPRETIPRLLNEVYGPFDTEPGAA